MLPPTRPPTDTLPPTAAADCAYALFKHLHAAYGDAMLQGVPPDLLYAAGGELQTPVVAQLCHVEQRVADK